MSEDHDAGPGRPRLLGICFNAHGTGLTRVMHEILVPLVDDFHVDYLAIAYKGEPFVHRGMHIHPTNPRGGDVYAGFQARAIIEEDPPELLFILHDLWVFENYVHVLELVRHDTLMVGYLPLDGDITVPRHVAHLHGLDLLVVYTEWARQQVLGAMEALGDPGEGRQWPRIEVIGHGVDLSAFQASSELLAADFHHHGRAAAKRQVFGELPDHDESFVVLNASRPCMRKRVDLTLRGFARFAEGKPPGVKLCLHQAITEESTHQLLDLAEELGVTDRLIYNPSNPEGGPISDADLNLLFNASDVGINTSMGEGWGLVSFEHAAAGAAQVVPRHTACQELWNDEVAVMLEPHTRGIPYFSPLELAEVSEESIAEALESLYTDRSRSADLARAAYHHARRPELQWGPMVDRWRELLAEARVARSAPA